MTIVDGDVGAASAHVDDRDDDSDLDAAATGDRRESRRGRGLLVVAVYGVISGSTVAEPAGDGRSSVHMVLRPDALTPGDNDVRVFVVDTVGGDEVLRAV